MLLSVFRTPFGATVSWAVALLLLATGAIVKYNTDGAFVIKIAVCESKDEVIPDFIVEQEIAQRGNPVVQLAPKNFSGKSGEILRETVCVAASDSRVATSSWSVYPDKIGKHQYARRSVTDAQHVHFLQVLAKDTADYSVMLQYETCFPTCKMSHIMIKLNGTDLAVVERNCLISGPVMMSALECVQQSPQCSSRSSQCAVSFTTASNLAETNAFAEACAWDAYYDTNMAYESAPYAIEGIKAMMEYAQCCNDQQYAYSMSVPLTDISNESIVSSTNIGRKQYGPSVHEFSHAVQPYCKLDGCSNGLLNHSHTIIYSTTDSRIDTSACTGTPLQLTMYDAVMTALFLPPSYFLACQTMDSTPLTDPLAPIAYQCNAVLGDLEAFTPDDVHITPTTVLSEQAMIELVVLSTNLTMSNATKLAHLNAQDQLILQQMKTKMLTSPAPASASPAPPPSPGNVSSTYTVSFTELEMQQLLSSLPSMFGPFINLFQSAKSPPVQFALQYRTSDCSSLAHVPVGNGYAYQSESAYMPFEWYLQGANTCLTTSTGYREHYFGEDVSAVFVINCANAERLQSRYWKDENFDRLSGAVMTKASNLTSMKSTIDLMGRARNVTSPLTSNTSMIAASRACTDTEDFEPHSAYLGLIVLSVIGVSGFAAALKWSEEDVFETAWIYCYIVYVAITAGLGQIFVILSGFAHSALQEVVLMSATNSMLFVGILFAFYVRPHVCERWVANALIGGFATAYWFFNLLQTLLIPYQGDVGGVVRFVSAFQGVFYLAFFLTVAVADLQPTLGVYAGAIAADLASKSTLLLGLLVQGRLMGDTNSDAAYGAIGITLLCVFILIGCGFEAAVARTVRKSSQPATNSSTFPGVDCGPPPVQLETMANYKK